MVSPLIFLGGGALALYLLSKAGGGSGGGPGSFAPDNTGILPAITETKVVGKSGTNYLSRVVGSNDAKNTIRVQIILNDGRTGHPNHLIMTYDAVRGSGGARTFVSRGAKTTDGLLATAMKDFAVKA